MSIVQNARAVNADLYKGRFFVLLAGFLWSLGGVFIKLLELHPLTIAFYRSFFASLFFSLFNMKKSWTVSIPLIISAVSYTMAISSFVWANKLTTAANAIVLQYTAPIFVFIFVRLFFHESISKPNLITLFLGMLGVGIIFFSGSADRPGTEGVTMAILSGFLLSIFLTNLRLLKDVNPGYLTLVNNLFCWLTLLPLVRFHWILSSGEGLALAVMGVVQLGVPYFLFSKGLETISLQDASLIVLIEPVLNPIWVALAIGEVPSAATFTGGGIILFSLVFRYGWLLLSNSREDGAPPHL